MHFFHSEKIAIIYFFILKLLICSEFILNELRMTDHKNMVTSIVLKNICSSKIQGRFISHNRLANRNVF